MANAKETAGRSSVAGTAVVLILLSAVGVGIGLAAGILSGRMDDGEPASSVAMENTGQLPQPTHDAVAGEDHAETEAGQGAGAGDDEERPKLRAVPFPPVLTTLSEPRGMWIRIEGSMLIRADAEGQPEVLVEKAATGLLAYLRSLRLKEIEGASGLAFFRQDMNDLVFALSEGVIQEVLIHGLVTE